MLSEIQLQSNCYRLATNEYRETYGMLFAIPNGGYRRSVEAMQLIASGLVAGEPDMLLIWPDEEGRPLCYPWEFKTEVGELLPSQILIHTAWAKHGFVIPIIRSAAEFFAGFHEIVRPDQTLFPDKVQEYIRRERSGCSEQKYFKDLL
jgi:hypothetical protein